MSDLYNDLYSVNQIRALESLAVEKYSISESVLMERAGKTAGNILQEKWPNAKCLVVFCSVGNNGGDGYVLANCLAAQIKEVIIYYVGELNRLKPHAREAYEACLKSGIKVLPFSQYQPHSFDVIVDALFGIGFQGDLKGEFKKVVSLINSSAA